MKAVVRPSDKPDQRPCIGCGKMRKSMNFGDRRCGKCAARAAGLSQRDIEGPTRTGK